MRKRIPFASGPRPLDPRICNIALDSNAMHRDGTPSDDLVDRFQKMSASGELTVVIAGGVRGEVQHPNPPVDEQSAVLPQIFNLRPELIAPQRAERRAVAAILQGNGPPGARAADASHLSEAAETGCGYFITHDRGILKKRRELRAALPPTLTVVTLAEFFAILEDYMQGRSP